ncbi:MAG: NAD-binding protein, partial [Phycisphaerae bacterium]|nr:NAD-binding protein [Phycisphaerae bacterium]
ADVCPPKRPLVIIGFGPAGQAVGQTLERLADRVTVIDLNPNMIRKAQQLELSGHIGDAMHADVLEHAGITSAAAAVVTIPDPTAARAIVELIRSIAPEVHIIARARYHRYSADLQAGGAHEVIDEEQFVGARLAARLRKRLRAVDRPATDD